MTNINVLKSYLDPSMVNLPVNEPVQFYGSPILQLQTKNPLPPVEALREEDKRAQGIPHIPYEPSVMYLEKQYRRATTVPGIPCEPLSPAVNPFTSSLYVLPKSMYSSSAFAGFWPGEPQEFGMMSFHSTDCLQSRPFDAPDDYSHALHSIALLSSFSWLLGQACYQGILSASSASLHQTLFKRLSCIILSVHLFFYSSFLVCRFLYIP